MFQNRSRAGQALAKMLLPYKREDVIVLGIPRGGVPVAFEIATLLKKPLGVVLVKKIGHPINKEYAIGAVSIEDQIIMPGHKVNEAYIEKEIKLIREMLIQQKSYYRARDYTSMQLNNKVVILVDDGLATGYTMLNTIRLIKKTHPRQVVIAVPVGPKETIDTLKKEGVTVVVMEIPYFFNGIGAFYEDFTQVENETVLDLLEQHHMTK